MRTVSITDGTTSLVSSTQAESAAVFKLAGVTRDDSTMSTGKVEKCVVEVNAGFQETDFRNEKVTRGDKIDDKSGNVPTAEDDGDVRKMFAEFEEMEFRKNNRE